MPPKSTRSRRLGGRCRGRVNRASDRKPDPEEMSDQPIQPESQRIAGPSRSNDDISLNISGNDTDVSSTCMVELLEFRDMRSK